MGAAPSPTWTHLFLTADSAHSQCAQLIALSRSGHDIPDRTACLAGTGQGFHGFKGRPWSAAPGNIHLAVHFAPARVIERFEVAFTILAALSVVDALDEVPGLRHRSGIRWVNDIVVDDAKLGGVLAYTQTRDRTVTSAVLGIGLNVEVTPAVGLTPFVPAVSSLRDLSADGACVTQREMLEQLLSALQRNYDRLLQTGYRPLLERYRKRSTIIGRECTVCTDESDMEIEVTATGRVIAIGDGLELHLEGERKPVTRGRLFIGQPRASARTGRYGTSRMPGPAGPESNDPEPRAEQDEC
jgi:BirA family biotin operon repressor/biotin-[acetyl-CoA-carboxylase] ligase